MTKSDLLNVFIQQITMQWSESEMEKPASVADIADMMQLLIMLAKALASRA